MKKSLDISTGKATILFLFIFISFGLLACTMVGKVIPVQNRILFSEKGVSQGTYTNGELTLDYNYSLVGRKLTLEGQVTSVWGADSIDVSLLFFDASGTTLQETIIYYSGYRDTSSATPDPTFKSMLIVPRGAVGMSFIMTDIAHEGRKI